MAKRSFADIQRLKKPNEVSVDLITDSALTRNLEELSRRHAVEERRDKRENRGAVAPGIQKEIDALTEQVEDSKITFTFRDPGRQDFDKLVEACPPSAADKKAAKENNQPAPNWDPEAFVPGLLSLSALDPKLTLDDALVLYNEWGRGDVEALFNAALQASLEQASIPFTKRDTEEIVSSVQRLITAQSEESPTDGS